jgi:hypothetical protein
MYRTAEIPKIKFKETTTLNTTALTQSSWNTTCLHCAPKFIKHFRIQTKIV